MNLAQTIMKLRKQNGWSQEDLAERLDVSRQSVSKWESAQSVPDLSKVVKLSEVFNVSTDYLIKDDNWDKTLSDDAQAPLPSINVEQAGHYLQTKLNNAYTIAKGVALCIYAPLPLILFLSVFESESASFPFDRSSVIFMGVVALLSLVALGVSFFVRSSQSESDLDLIENKSFEISKATRAFLTAKRKEHAPNYTKNISLGVGLFIFSAVPILFSELVLNDSTMTAATVALLFIIVSIGLFFIIPTSTYKEALTLLLQEGNRDADKSEETKDAEKLASFYWPLLIAIYIGWSLWTMEWGVTWIVWPVGAIFYASLVGLMGLLKKEQSQL